MRSIQLKALLLGLVMIGIGSHEVVAQGVRTQVVSYASVWRYDQSGTDLGTGWRAPAFNDTAWLSGAGALGFPANELLLNAATVQTVVNRFVTGGSGPQITNYYFRLRFNLPSNQGVSLVASNLIDDGAIFYLNGNEITRLAMPAGAVNARTFSTRADDITDHGIEVFNIPSSALLTGENVLAVEVHQGGANSSDIIFGMSVWATLPATGPATIVTQPTNLVAAVGQSVTFHADVSGTTPYTFQWKKNGANINGATGQDYVIANASIADQARYSFTVSNALGGAESTSALLFITSPNENLLAFNKTWKYLVTSSDQGSAWRESGFNDASWLSGPGPLGLETAAIPVPIATSFALNGELTYYFRSTFVFTNNPNDITLVLTNELDDGAVYYINGVEVLRVGMDTGPVTFTSTSSRSVGDAALEVVTLPATALIRGTNLIAVEAHQVNRGSSDLTFGLAMTARYLAPTEIIITNQPLNLVVEELKSAVFTVGVSGNTPRFQWFKDGVLIPNAVDPSFRIAAATTNDNGLYQVVVSNFVNQVQSDLVRLTVLPDTNPPALLSADGTRSATLIIASYSERVVPSLATNIANYTVTNTAGSTLAISRAVLTNGTNVLLTTAARTDGQNYLLFARNIRDIVVASNQIPANTVVPIRSLIRVIEANFGWKFIDPFPGIDPLDFGTEWRFENYDEDDFFVDGSGAFIYDPSNEDYPFEQGTVLSQGSTTKYFRLTFPYTAAPSGAIVTIRHMIDDGAVFYMNGREVLHFNLPATVDYLTPGSAVATASIISTNIPPDSLRVGNNLLAVELHGTSSNDLDYVFGMEMTASVLSFAVGPIIFTGKPVTNTVAEGMPVTFDFTVVGATTFQWFDNDVAIPGATNSTYTINSASIGMNNHTFKVTAGRPGATSVTSGNSLLRVVVDNTAPTLLGAVGDGATITLTFSEIIDPTSGAAAANYTVTNATGTARTVNTAVVQSNKVVLTLSAFARIGDVVVVRNVKDASSTGNSIVAGSAVRVGFSQFLVQLASVWRYDQTGMDRMTDWRNSGYNDSAWPSGPGLLAFETVALTEPIRTVLLNPQTTTPPGWITTYYRTRFNFAGLPPGGTFSIRHFLDDGAVFYLNGQEFYRIRMPTPVPLFDTLADPTAVGDAASEGPFTVTLPSIVIGTNVLAVEVHQNSAGSSDIAMGAELIMPEVPTVVLPPPNTNTAPTLVIERLGTNALSSNNLRLTWSASDYRLQQSSLATSNSWTDVPNATSPFTITPSTLGPIRFYRLIK